jgi:hypothetical protein
MMDCSKDFNEENSEPAVFLLFVVLTFLGESFAGSGLFMLPLVEEASLVEAFVDLFLFVIVTSTVTKLVINV